MSMKKIPLALAIGAAFACSGASAQSSVTIYGKLYPHIVNEDGSGATPVGTPRSTLSSSLQGVDGVSRNTGFTNGNSRIGFRGQEDLGGGLKAIFQMEGTIEVSTGAGGDPFWDRNTFVGLDSKQFGTVKLGRMDTIFKDYGDTLGILGVSSGTFMSSSNILRKPGFGTSSKARFHERFGDSIQYETPEFAGFQIGFQASDDALPDDAGQQKAYSFGVKYDKGPWYVAIAHEIHKDFFGGSAQAPSSLRNTAAAGGTSKDRATQFTVEWRMNKMHKFEFDVIQKQYKETGATGKFGSYKNTAYQLAMENRWTGNFRTAAHIVKSSAGSCSIIGGAACSTDGLEGTKITIGAAYYFSRRTYAFASLADLKNGKSARYSTAQNLGQRTNYGEDLRQFGAGLSHSF